MEDSMWHVLHAMKYNARAEAALKKVQDRILARNKLVPPGFRPSVISKQPFDPQDRSYLHWIFSIEPQTAPDQFKRSEEWLRSLITCNLFINKGYQGQLVVADAQGVRRQIVWAMIVESPECKERFITDEEAERAAMQMCIYAADYDAVVHLPEGSHRQRKYE